MKRSSVLIEIILSIVFFAFASLLLLRVMAYSDNLNRRSSDELNAVLEMQSTVERLRADSDGLEEICTEGGALTLYYDAGFSPCIESAAERYINIAVTGDENSVGCVYSLRLDSFTKKGESISGLEAAIYVPGGGGASYER